MKTHDLENKMQEERIMETINEANAVNIIQPKKYSKQENCHIEVLILLNILLLII